MRRPVYPVRRTASYTHTPFRISAGTQCTPCRVVAFLVDTSTCMRDSTNGQGRCCVGHYDMNVLALLEGGCMATHSSGPASSWQTKQAHASPKLIVQFCTQRCGDFGSRHGKISTLRWTPSGLQRGWDSIMLPSEGHRPVGSVVRATVKWQGRQSVRPRTSGTLPCTAC